MDDNKKLAWRRAESAQFDRGSRRGVKILLCLAVLWSLGMETWETLIGFLVTFVILVLCRLAINWSRSPNLPEWLKKDLTK